MQITYDDLVSKEPCYDPIRYYAKDWTGTLLDIIKNEAIPAEDRVWVFSQFADDKTARLFAVRCARRALSKVEFDGKQKCLETCDITEKYANGNATTEELKAAAAADAADAARAAATWAADAAWAARAAEAAAAAEAADAAARAAAWADAAARAAAWAAERQNQITDIVELIS